MEPYFRAGRGKGASKRMSRAKAFFAAALPLWLVLALIATSVIGVSALVGSGLLATNVLTASVSVESPNVTVTLELDAGWNMVSLPVMPEVPVSASVLSDVGFYQLVTWSGSGYVSATSFEEGRGYWLLVLQATNLTVTGTPLSEVNLTLSPGWSMVGGPYSAVQASEVFSSFYQLVTWSGTGYTMSSEFVPGMGYWVLVLEKTQIQLPPT